MPLKRFPYIPGSALNTCNTASSTGLAEPVTGLALPSGNVPGDKFALTDAEALAVSKTSVGTLYSGVYMWALIDSAATTLALGQLLWLKTGGATPYYFTNVEPTNASPPAAILINAVAGITAGNYCFVQLIEGGVGTVLFRAVLTGAAAVDQAVYAAGAGAGASNATADVLDDANPTTGTMVGNMLARRIGVSKVLPVAGAASTVFLATRVAGEI